MAQRCFAFTCILALAAACVGAAQPQGEDARLEAFFKSYLDGAFRLQPSSASGAGEHRYDHLLEDVSAAGRKQWLDHDQQTLKSLSKTIQRDALTPAGRVDYDTLQSELGRSIWLTENFHPFAEDPRTYSGYLADSVYTLLAQSSLPLEVNVSNSIARIKQLPRIVSAAKANITRPPKQHLETAIRQNQGSIGFYEKGIFALTADSKQKAALETACREAVVHLKNYQEFLEKEVSPRATGEWRIGKRKFYKKLELGLDAGLTAGEVLAAAESEFDRVQREMYVISRQLWSKYCPGQVLPPDDAEGRRTTIQKVVAQVSQEHGSPAKLVEDIRETVSAIKKFIAEKHILALPDPDTCQIVEMPEFKRGNSIAYMQSPPPLDPNTAGFYAVSPPPSDWDAARVKTFLEEYNRHMNQILTIHEAYPGHYVQLEYANDNPSLIRKVLSSGVYVEGWAVYTEQMMLDQGYGEGSLPLRLNQLKFYLRAVANAILDHKMHCTQMSDDEALSFLTHQAYQSEGEARLKVIRSKQSSVQLSTYFVGRMAMYRLRQSVQREMGDAFNLAAFHEAILKEGAVPVKHLPALVRARLAK